MKRENKKLLGIAAVGLSAWLLVAALMQFDNSTQAMLRNDPVPTQDHSVVSSSSDQPRTHGATADETTTSSNQPMTASDPQVMSATTMHTPATNLAHDGPHHEGEEAHAIAGDIAEKSSKIPTIMAIASGTLLFLGSLTAAIYLRRKKKSSAPQTT